MNIESSFFRMLTKATIKGLRNYYEDGESLLESAKKNDKARITQEIKAIVKKLDLSKDEEYTEWNLKMQEHDTKLNMLFTNLFRYSFVVLSFLILEDHLYKFCQVLHDENEALTAPPNVHGSTLKQYINYIKRDTRISDMPNIWQALHDLRFVRNCIVHSSGNVERSRNKDRLIRISEQNIGLNISSVKNTQLIPLYFKDNMIILESSYCMSIVELIEKLFDILCNAVNLPSEIKVEDGEIIFE